MRKILVVGIGAGNPEHITVQAINALNRADALFVPRKGETKAELADLRREIIQRYVTNPEAKIVEFDLPVRDAENLSYVSGVTDWHQAIAELYSRLMETELAADGVAALMVWGDPSLFDGTLRILDRVRAAGLRFDLEVVPGVSSLHALTAAHAIPLNLVGRPVVVTPARRLAEVAPHGDAIVFLDSRLAFTTVDGAAYDIYWGAYLGTRHEILISGRLADVAAEIEQRRAAARLEHGWIMDTYLLRHRSSDPSDESPD